MAHKTRPRMIYPGLWNHRKFYGISSDAFRVWVWMVSQADDEGRAEYYPGLVAQMPFLGCPLSDKAAVEAIEEVAERELADLYEANGRSYYQLHDWEDFQVIRKDRLVRSTCPQSPHFAALRGGSPQNAALGGLKVKVKDNGNVKDKDNDNGRADAQDDDPPASPDLGVRLAKLLQAALRENHPNTRPTATAHDAENIRQVATRLPEADMEALIRWAAADPFWASVLLARGGPGAKFREQFDAIMTRWESSDEDRANDRVFAQAERELREAGEIP